MSDAHRLMKRPCSVQNGHPSTPRCCMHLGCEGQIQRRGRLSRHGSSAEGYIAQLRLKIYQQKPTTPDALLLCSNPLSSTSGGILGHHPPAKRSCGLIRTRIARTTPLLNASPVQPAAIGLPPSLSTEDLSGEGGPFGGRDSQTTYHLTILRVEGGHATSKTPSSNFYSSAAANSRVKVHHVAQRSGLERVDGVLPPSLRGCELGC
jgi:hypothetical protein